jgi:hypothetical protein
MINSKDYSSYKKKYPFLKNVLNEGYGHRYSLFEITEVTGIEERIADCTISGFSGAGGEFVSWDWSGIKNNLNVNLSAHKTVRESLQNKDLDYIICEELLTLEHSDTSSTDRSITIYQVKGEPIK